MVVTEQHRVDRTELRERDRWPVQLARSGTPTKEIPATRRIEGRIGDQPPRSDLEHGSRSTNVENPYHAHRHLAASLHGQRSQWHKTIATVIPTVPTLCCRRSRTW